MRPAVVLVLACVLLSGCSGTADEEPGDCMAEEDYNPHESRCVRAASPDYEVCHAFIEGSADDDAAKVSCQAVSTDGQAWLDHGLVVAGTAHVTVRDGKGATVYETNLGNSQDSIKLRGAKGSWTLAVDFDDAAGTGTIVLWG